MSFSRYPAYKDSGVEWLGEVPEHWDGLRLRFAAMLNPSKQEARSIGVKESVSFLPMEAIGEDGTLILEQEKEVDECLTGYTYFKEGDVCIAKITPCFENGKGAILRGLKGGIGFGTTELIVARPKLTKLTTEFLDYLFRSNTFRSLGESSMYGAGGQKRVPDSFVRDFASFLPPIAEQASIVTFLDRETAKIDALIAEQQRLIELLQEKRQAVISHAVTKGLNPDAPMKDSGVEWLGEVPEHWRLTRLKYITTPASGIQMGPFGGMLVDLEEQETGYKLYGQENTISGDLCLGQRWLAHDHFLNLTGYHVHNGDILLTRKGSLGNALLVNDLPCPGAIDSDTVRVRVLEGLVDSSFLVLLLHEAGYTKEQLSRQKRGAILPGLNTANIANLCILLPPLLEQASILRHIHACLNEFLEQLGNSEKVIQLLQERRSALISAAVTGQIDVRGLVAEGSAA
jgi:type I restriction enzyme S subunit